MDAKVGTYMPQGNLIRGRYVGSGAALKGTTCLMCDMGEFWSVQVDQHPLGFMCYGWWEGTKEEWEQL